MGFAIEKLGQWTEGPEFKVEADRTKAYAAATNDPNARAPERRGRAAGVRGGPDLGHDRPARWPGVVPPEVLMLVVHGEQDMRLHKPITPGHGAAGPRRAPVGIHVKPNGTSVIAKVETARPDRRPRRRAVHDVVLPRRERRRGRAARKRPTHKLDARRRRPASRSASITQQLDTDQTYRYAEASGDNMPIHLDAEIAKSVGLPGIIIHGLCTMAFTSWAAVQEVCGGDSTRLKRLAVRFSRPCSPVRRSPRRSGPRARPTATRCSASRPATATARS